ncbi:MAG: Na+/H+ antiporter subunit E [Planctomycetota bacterium]
MRTLALALILAALWLLMSGHYDGLLLSLGGIAVLFVIAVARRLRLIDREGVWLELVPGLPLYFLWLLKEIVVSNLAVARRIVSPKLAIEPSVFRVPGQQSDDVGRGLYANSITLTPGTVTIDVDDETMVVHALTSASRAGLETGAMGRKVARVSKAVGGESAGER